MAIGSYSPLRSAAAYKVNYKKLMTHIDLLSNEYRASSWMESMKESSPTHLRSIADIDWSRGLPSALGKFKEIAAVAKGKKIVMFLNYNGTLSPIMEDPDSTFMSDSMREAMKSVAKYFLTVIMMWRSVDKEVFYAGSHGMDIKGPNKCHKNIKTQSVLFEPGSEFLPMIVEVYNLLLEKTKLIPGCKVENNRFCVLVHFQCVEEKRWSALTEDVRPVLADYQDLQLTQGKKVFEVRPTIEWNKEFVDCGDVLPVYIGDDQTDEDAFKVLILPCLCFLSIDEGKTTWDQQGSKFVAKAY